MVDYKSSHYVVADLTVFSTKMSYSTDFKCPSRAHILLSSMCINTESKIWVNVSYWLQKWVSLGRNTVLFLSLWFPLLVVEGEGMREIELLPHFSHFIWHLYLQLWAHVVSPTGGRQRLWAARVCDSLCCGCEGCWDPRWAGERKGKLELTSGNTKCLWHSRGSRVWGQRANTWAWVWMEVSWVSFSGLSYLENNLKQYTK